MAPRIARGSLDVVATDTCLGGESALGSPDSTFARYIARALGTSIGVLDMVAERDGLVVKHAPADLVVPGTSLLLVPGSS